MRLILPSCILMCVLLSVAGAPAQSVAATALANSLQQDFASVQVILDNGQPPWASVDSRPQPEPINALRLELPGNCIWAAFKPVDAAIREAFRQQRKLFVDKDAGLIDRRAARTGLEALSAAILQERPDYDRSLIRGARLQVLQIDNALEHDEYHAAECLMWAMADRLGLCDRQAALESAASHLTLLRARARGRRSLSAKEVKFYKNQIGCLSTMVERAITWQAAPSYMAAELPPPPPTAMAQQATEPNQRFAQNLRFGCDGLEGQARNTYDLSPCPQRYRDWQYTLRDFRYGWLVYTHSAANGPWRPHGDWRELQPQTFWPAAKGSTTGGGL